MLTATLYGIAGIVVWEIAKRLTRLAVSMPSAAPFVRWWKEPCDRATFLMIWFGCFTAFLVALTVFMISDGTPERQAERRERAIDNAVTRALARGPVP